MATATKTSLKKWSRAASTLSRLFRLVQFVKCWQFYLELNSKRLYGSSEKEESRCLVYTSSTKRSIRHFHVVVVQWQQRNVQKSVMHVQSCCFADLNLLLSFMLSSLTSPSSLLKHPDRVSCERSVRRLPIQLQLQPEFFRTSQAGSLTVAWTVEHINLFFPFSLHCFRMPRISFSVVIWNVMHFTR